MTTIEQSQGFKQLAVEDFRISEEPFYLPISTIDESADFTAYRILLALDVINELPSHMQYKP